MSTPERTEHLVLPGVLTAEQAAETVAALRAVQREDGALPWFRGHHLDPWDHTEAAMALDAAGEHEAAARAYAWLARHQNEDGSWYAAYHDGDAEQPTDLGRETNFCAYVAVGVWHHYLATGDDAFADRMWPTVYAAIEFVLRLQQPGGEIGWKREADGTPVTDALLTGSSSVHHALRCALALAEEREEPQPDWELATGALGHAIRSHPERFLDKSRYSMDWYYPVLGGAVTGPAATRRIDEGWDSFVVPGLGVRCVLPNPWVTGGESCELALALWVTGSPTGPWRSCSPSSTCAPRAACTGRDTSSRASGPSGRRSSPPGRRVRCCSRWPRSGGRGDHRGLRRRTAAGRPGTGLLPGEGSPLEAADPARHGVTDEQVDGRGQTVAGDDPRPRFVEREQVVRPAGQPVGRVLDELHQVVGPVGVEQVHQDPQDDDERHDVRDDGYDTCGGTAS